MRQGNPKEYFYLTYSSSLKCSNEKISIKECKKNLINYLITKVSVPHTKSFTFILKYKERQYAKELCYPSHNSNKITLSKNNWEKHFIYLRGMHGIMQKKAFSADFIHCHESFFFFYIYKE